MFYLVSNEGGVVREALGAVRAAVTLLAPVPFQMRRQCALAAVNLRAEVADKLLNTQVRFDVTAQEDAIIITLFAHVAL